MAFMHKTTDVPAHQHETVEQARQCEEQILRDQWQAQMEIEAEQAIERYYETNEVQAWETQQELAMEAAWA